MGTLAKTRRARRPESGGEDGLRHPNPGGIDVEMARVTTLDDLELIDHDTDQPPRLPARVRRAITGATGAPSVAAYALVDLDGALRLTAVERVVALLEGAAVSERSVEANPAARASSPRLRHTSLDLIWGRASTASPCAAHRGAGRRCAAGWDRSSARRSLANGPTGA